MYAACILAKTQSKTTVLGQPGKRDHFSTGRGFIIGILWYKVTGEVSQINFNLELILLTIK